MSTDCRTDLLHRIALTGQSYAGPLSRCFYGVAAGILFSTVPGFKAGMNRTSVYKIFSGGSFIINVTVSKRTSKQKRRTPHQEKGDALENAVTRIEQHLMRSPDPMMAVEQYLLRITPELHEQDFKFETKKRVIVDGGQREIDIYVTHGAAHGYESIFIYECRNRKKPANWEDVAAFRRKIEVTSATWGCFVSKKFAKSARKEAEKDPRVRLLVAEEILEPIALFVHCPQLTGLNVTLRRLIGGDPVDYSALPVPETYYRSWAVPLKQMLVGVAQQVCMADIEKFLETTPNEGIHRFEKRAMVPLSRMELVVNNEEIAEAIFEIRYQINVLPTAVTSHFVVESRGRYIKAENVKLGGCDIPVEFVMVSPQGSLK